MAPRRRTDVSARARQHGPGRLLRRGAAPAGRIPRLAAGEGAMKAVENLALSAALGAMAILPLAEIALRAMLHTGISGAASLTQHLALVASMLGAAVAAREGRLLSLSTIDSLLAGRRALVARFFTRPGAGVGAALLGLASAPIWAPG